MSFSQRVVQQGSFVRNRFEYPLPCLPWVGCSYIFPRILWARNYFAGPACWRCRTIGNQRKHPISVCWEIDSRYWFRQSGCAGLLSGGSGWWRRNLELLWVNRNPSPAFLFPAGRSSSRWDSRSGWYAESAHSRLQSWSYVIYTRRYDRLAAPYENQGFVG